MGKDNLKRVISLPALVFYGLGTIIGAGIYVLIGKVSVQAGYFMPVSFLLAGVIATFSALSYGELASRYPRSAGEVVYVQNAFNIAFISRLIGFAIILVGIVSAAAIARGFVNYAQNLVDFSSDKILIFFVIALSLVAIWGVVESVFLAVVVTLIEIFGLLLVIVLGFWQIDSVQANNFATMDINIEVVVGVIAGAFLAFYAYVGFEDMVNMAEEVKDVKTNMLKAIIITLVISVILYILVALTLIMAVPIDKLMASDAPLTLIFESFAGGVLFISIISMIATINGSLVQIIMGSRVLYGMGRANLAWKGFARVNSKTKTPIIATIFVGFTVLIFSLWLPLVTLAKTTSFITLIIFIMVNFALIVEKNKRPDMGVVKVAIYIPITGVMLSSLLLLSQLL